MSTNAIKKLEHHLIRNARDLRFPNSCPATNSLKKHLEIYNLISEYIALDADLAKVSSPAVKNIIEKHMDEIKYKLTGYWILESSEMIRSEDNTTWR